MTWILIYRKLRRLVRLPDEADRGILSLFIFVEKRL